ncbi:MAG: XRE family transcriptional regulator [Bacteroidota bacterium]
MNDHVLLQIGKKIKSIRRGSGSTIQEIADKAGVSKGLISKIENGRTVPSLPVLLGIIQALGSEIPTFFEGIEYIKYDGYVHKSKDDYGTFEKENAKGFVYRTVLEQSFTNLSIEINILDLMPENTRELVTTDGYTYLYMLKGEVDYILAEKTLTLKSEDSLFFNGKIPHKPINKSGEVASILVVYLLISHVE